MTAEELKAWAQNLPDTATVESMSVSDDGKGTVTWHELKLGEIRAVIGSTAPFRDNPVGVDTIRRPILKRGEMLSAAQRLVREAGHIDGRKRRRRRSAGPGRRRAA